MDKNTTEIGNKYEDLARNLLEKKDYEIIASKYRYNNKNFVFDKSRRSEIDIIAIKEGVLHFFEVRKRRVLSYDYPVVSLKKILHLKNCAMNFIESNPLYSDFTYTIDLITIDDENNIEIIENLTSSVDLE